HPANHDARVADGCRNGLLFGDLDGPQFRLGVAVVRRAHGDPDSKSEQNDSNQDHCDTHKPLLVRKEQATRTRRRAPPAIRNASRPCCLPMWKAARTDVSARCWRWAAA